MILATPSKLETETLLYRMALNYILKRRDVTCPGEGGMLWSTAIDNLRDGSQMLGCLPT